MWQLVVPHRHHLRLECEAVSGAPSYKRAVPRVSEHVARPGLAARLSDAVRRASLVWVVGLPGSGKTSLVARWIAECERPYFWYRLDENDVDVASLFDAIAHFVSDSRRLPVWSPENQADLAEFARSFFGELAREPLTLVLDDCHRVADDSAVLRVLEQLREVGGDSLRAVLVSRRGPPPALARGLVGGWLELVDGLRLSAAETRAIAVALRGGELSAAETRALEHTDGWLAHVLALARARSSDVDLPADLDTHVGEFLAAELLAAVPAEQRPGLRRLAELPEIPKELGPPCVAPEVARLLGTLSDQRYFVETIERRFRLHDLLRDALRALNAQHDDDATLRAARRGLADHVSELLPEAAMQLRVDAGDVDGALALLEARGAEWLARGLHRTLHTWLAGLAEPAEVVPQAGLASWRAQALLPIEPEAARPLFSKARRLAVASRDATRAYAAWCGEVSSYVVQWGAAGGSKFADIALDSTGTAFNGVSASFRPEYTICFDELGTPYVYCPDLKDRNEMLDGKVRVKSGTFKLDIVVQRYTGEISIQ